MAFCGIGEVSEMTPDLVSGMSIKVLKQAMIDAEQEIFRNCCLCGKEKAVEMQDPGMLTLEPFKCAEATECNRPARPKPPIRFFLRPGCLVFAIIDKVKQRWWPGIIEHSPDTHDYCSMVEERVTVYFVTFIFPDDHTPRWQGGFVKAINVRPFLRMERVAALPFAERPVQRLFERSIELGRAARDLSLRERLLRFSFVAHVARLMNRSLDDFHPRRWTDERPEPRPLYELQGKLKLKKPEPPPEIDDSD